MEKFGKVGSVLTFIFLGIALFICVYLIADVGNAQEVLEAYYQVEPTTTSSFSKTQQFLRTYIMQTGDATIGMTLGLSDEDINELINNPGGSGGSGGGGTNGVTTPWDATTINTAIAEHCTSWGGYDTANWSTQEINGVYYPRQLQSKALFSGVQNTANQTIKGKGCMWYAMQTIVSAKSGELWGIEDLLTKVGYTVTYSNGVMTTNTKLPCVGLDSSKVYADGSTTATPDAILNATGKVTCSGDKGSDSSQIDSSKICLVHITGEPTPRQMSSGGEHWFLIVGESGNNYIIANDPSTQVSKDRLHQYLNHLYIID